jgi:ADP-dependent NAD(P)H-hydrate dehydratase / NAD(P)H-hydrate epimerase
MVAMYVLSAAEMQACDRLTTERFGIPSIDLMRAASSAVAKFALEQFPGSHRVTVICGRGNNGGDGMMAARLLALAGVEVTTLLLGLPEDLTGDAAEAWRELVDLARGLVSSLPASPSKHEPERIETRIHVIHGVEELTRHNKTLDTDLIVDAVVGTGFKPPLRGLALAALEWMRKSKAPVLAVDLPSGWPADETAATMDGNVYPADAVLTFTSPKPAHLFGQLTRRWSQPIAVAPIGSPGEAIVASLAEGNPRMNWAGSALAMVQKPRASEANKGRFGHVLVVGGTFGSAGGKAGAPAMAALAALRAGAGLVTAAVPAPALGVVASVAPEMMTWPLEATEAGQIAAAGAAPEKMTALIGGKTVLALGPGLGHAPETVKFMDSLLDATSIPAVIDADGLNLLAAEAALMAKVSAQAAGGRVFVLTPHPGEMARLAGMSVSEVQRDRLSTAREFARKTGVTLVLKGSRTLIAHPDGRVAINTTGNPGMAKGGSGDVLTGVVAGLLAQYPEDMAQAVEAAVYLHGLAADLVLREADEHTILATDILARLSKAFSFRARGSSGYVWLQGLPAETPSTAVPLFEAQP